MTMPSMHQPGRLYLCETAVWLTRAEMGTPEIRSRNVKSCDLRDQKHFLVSLVHNFCSIDIQYIEKVNYVYLQTKMIEN